MTPLLLLALAFAIQDAPPAKCTISGTVVDAATRQPLSKVNIQVEGLGDESTGVPFTTTDSHGNFTIVDLPPGQYRLNGHRNGYLDTCYGARRAEGDGTPITLEPGGNLAGIEFKLMPFAVIAGTVRDQDGEALVRAKVTVHRLVYDDGRRRVVKANNEDILTDDLGQFRVTGLVPGKYYVRAEPADMAALLGRDQSPKTDHPPEILLPALYPGVMDPAAARPVDVSAGARVTGIDIALPRSTTQPVRGHVAVGAGGTLSFIALDYAGGGGGDAGYQFEARKKPNGDFEFPAVPPGSYVLRAFAEPPKKASTNLFEVIFSQHRYSARVPVQVGSVPVENVQVVLGAPAEIAGRLIIEGDKPADPDFGRGGSIRGAANRSGTFSMDLPPEQVTFDNGSDDPVQATVDGRQVHTTLGPGHYNIDWESNDGYVLHRIQLEGKDITEEGLTVAGAAPIQLDFVVGKDGAEIEGTVTDKDSKPAAGATVVLVPEPGLRAHSGLFQQLETDQSGRFEMKGIRPGTYKLFAWDDVEPGIWWDPDFLKDYEGKAQPVTLKPGGHETASLHVIAAADQ